jgi:hypothetical protein
MDYNCEEDLQHHFSLSLSFLINKPKKVNAHQAFGGWGVGGILCPPLIVPGSYIRRGAFEYACEI